MKLQCLQAGQLMQRKAQGLSAAEGLTLEEHISGCSDCRSDASLLTGLVGLAAQTPVELSADARQRVIAAAFEAAARERVPQPRVASSPLLVLLGAAAAVALTSVVLLRSTPAATPAARAPVASAPATINHAEGDRVLSGRVELAGSERKEGQTIATGETFSSARGAVLALAHAQVELRPDTSAQWDADARSFSLRRGSVMVEVDPARHESFAVESSAFTVQVLGTRFEVTETSVHVVRGRVSVQPKGATTEPVLLIGGSEQADFPLATEQETETAADPSRQPATAATTQRGRAQDAVSGSALLEQARTQLAARQIRRARRTLEQALPVLRGAPLRAEALSLQAECHLLAQHYPTARDAYLRVARQFEDLPAGETALYAAARIEAEHGKSARAQSLLERYLTQYPQGSFVREATRRLRALQQTAPPAPQEPSP